MAANCGGTFGTGSEAQFTHLKLDLVAAVAPDLHQRDFDTTKHTIILKVERVLDLPAVGAPIKSFRTELSHSDELGPIMGACVTCSVVHGGVGVTVFAQTLMTQTAATGVSSTHSLEDRQEDPEDTQTDGIQGLRWCTRTPLAPSSSPNCTRVSRALDSCPARWLRPPELSDTIGTQNPNLRPKKAKGLFKTERENRAANGSERDCSDASEVGTQGWAN